MFKKQIQEFEAALILARGAIEHFTLAREIFIQKKDDHGARWGDVIASDTYGCTLTEAVTFAITSLDAFSRLKADAKTTAPIPELRGCVSAVERLRALSDQIYSSANTIEGDVREIIFGDYGQAVLQNSGEIIYQPHGTVNEIVSYSTDLSSKVGIIRSSNQASGKPAELEADKVVVSRVNAAVETLKTIDLDSEKVRGQIRDAEERLGEFQIENARISDLLAKLESHLSKDAQEIDRVLADANRSSEKIIEQSAMVQARHADVMQQASESSAAFKDIRAFSAEVGTARARIDELEKISERTVVAQVSQKDKVDSLLNQANKMLSGATIAGLASTFDVERKQLDKSLNGAFITFCIGVLLLTIFSLFVIMYVLNVQINPKLLGWIFVQAPGIKAHDVTVPGMVARSIILLAPLWFTQFSARRYRQLFDLRQQYAHKYNVAFSADGFAKASKAHKDEIMLWVFETIGTNPAPPKYARPQSMDEAPTHPIGSESADKMVEVSGSFGKRLLLGIAGRMS